MQQQVNVNSLDLQRAKAEVRQQTEARRNEKVAKPQYEFESVEVVNNGKQIILPDGMTKHEGIEWLRRQIEQDNRETAIHEEIIAYPLEGAYALMQVCKAVYGWTSPVPTPGFFGDEPPHFVNLEIAYGEQAQVVWGRFQLPGIEGYLETNATRKDGRFVFVLGGVVKQKYKDDVARIAQLVRMWVKEKSIYRGKAIRLKTTDKGELNLASAPGFLDTRQTNPAMLIFSDNVRVQVETHIFTPIKKTKLCRQYGIPLKRTVLLEGPFGTGKTLTAHVAAKHAEDNGWTFIYLDRVTALKDALIFARQYGPAAIFAEDIDRVVTGGRTVAVDDILNTIDGVDSKHDETLVILTTNDVEKIEKAMIRPGRLDSIIHVGPPDALAAQKLIRYYAGELLSAKEDLSEAGKELDGQIPATIAEVVKRSKLYAVGTTDGDGDTKVQLKGKDLAEAARGMKAHLKLLEENKEVVSPEEQFGRAMSGLLNGNITVAVEKSRLVKETHERVCR